MENYFTETSMFISVFRIFFHALLDYNQGYSESLEKPVLKYKKPFIISGTGAVIWSKLTLGLLAIVTLEAIPSSRMHRSQSF
jgi:hypothetical protein